VKSRNLGFFFSRIAHHNKAIQDKRSKAPVLPLGKMFILFSTNLILKRQSTAIFMLLLLLNLFQSSSDTFEQTKAASVQCLHA